MDGRRHASSSPSSSSLYKGKPSGGLGKSRPSSYPPWKEEELIDRIEKKTTHHDLTHHIYLSMMIDRYMISIYVYIYE